MPPMDCVVANGATPAAKPKCKTFYARLIVVAVESSLSVGNGAEMTGGARLGEHGPRGARTHVAAIRPKAIGRAGRGVRAGRRRILSLDFGFSGGNKVFEVAPHGAGTAGGPHRRNVPCAIGSHPCGQTCPIGEQQRASTAAQSWHTTSGASQWNRHGRRRHHTGVYYPPSARKRALLPHSWGGRSAVRAAASDGSALGTDSFVSHVAWELAAAFSSLRSNS